MNYHRSRKRSEEDGIGMWKREGQRGLVFRDIYSLVGGDCLSSFCGSGGEAEGHSKKDGFVFLLSPFVLSCLDTMVLNSIIFSVIFSRFMFRTWLCKSILGDP